MNQIVEAVRSFNRFYTKHIGLLHKGYLKSSFSLTEVRVLYELAHRRGTTASALNLDLGLDAGYLSRILRSFEKEGLMKRKTSVNDGRQSHLFLTTRGLKAFAPLNSQAGEEIGAMTSRLSAEQQNTLRESMRTIENLLGDRSESTAPYLIRSHKPGDMGWVIHRHGVLYFQEYGWDERFEALVAEIAAKFICHFDPRRERCWIAERDGAILGSVFLVSESAEVAKLRLLLVEPSARGMGLGNRLVHECIQFARQAAYKKITLWTQSILHAAQHIYQKAGFRLVREQPHQDFGIELTSQIWELTL